MQRIKSVLLLVSLGIFAAVHSFPHVENVSTENGKETAKQLVLSPQEVYLLQLQQTLQQQQNVALAEANRKLLQQQEEIDDSDEEDDDPFLRSAIPEDSAEIFPEKTRNDKDEEDVVYAIVYNADDDEIREAAEGNTSPTGVPATVVTVAPVPAETATTHYVNVPASDQASSAYSDESSSGSTTENVSVSTNVPPAGSSIPSEEPSAVSVAPESAASNAPEGPVAPGSPDSAPTSNVTSASTPASGATLSTKAPSRVSTPSSGSTISSSPTPDSPVNPNLASSTAAAPLSNVSSGATTPSSINLSSSSSVANETSVSTSSTTKKPPRQRPPYRATMKCRCGTQTTRKLYIGSTRVNTNTYPWTVSVTRNGTHMCTGSIINSKYVLTSASCLKGASPKDLLVRAALSTPSKKITYNVNSVSYHPGYKAQGLANNLALVEVQEDIKPSKNVKFVCLPLEEQRDNDCGTIVSVSEDRGSKNLTMVQQQVKKITVARCATLLRRAVDKNDTFCTAPPSRYCGGDTGGSYITPGKGYSFTLRGLVNSSSGCKARRQPAVFTNVRRYTNWILYKSQSGSYCKVPSFRRELFNLPE